MSALKRSELKRKPMKRRSPNATVKADVEYSRIIRASGQCDAAGVDFDCAGYIQCAHIISRRYRATRWSIDPDNAIPLCSAHHVYWTHHPLEWEDYIRATYPGLWEELRSMALHGKPEKAADALARLKGR